MWLSYAKPLAVVALAFWAGLAGFPKILDGMVSATARPAELDDPRFWCGTCMEQSYGHASRFPEGEKLFKANCASCHKVDKRLVGPMLQGATERNSMEWLIDFTRDSQAMIEAGDPYAVAIYEAYNKTQMTSFPNLTDEDIMQIYAYIDGWEPPEPVAVP